MDKENNQKFSEILKVVKSIEKSSATKDDLRDLATKGDLSEVREMVEFIKDNAATRNDIVGLEKRMDILEQNISGLKIQLLSVENELEDIKETLKELEVKVGEDTDSVAQNVCILEKKLEKLQRNVSHLQIV